MTLTEIKRAPLAAGKFAKVRVLNLYSMQGTADQLRGMAKSNRNVSFAGLQRIGKWAMKAKHTNQHRLGLIEVISGKLWGDANSRMPHAWGEKQGQI